MLEINKFLASNLRHAWVAALGYDVYIKKGRHYLQGEIKNTVDISSVHSADPNSTPGRFWELVQKIGAQAEETRSLEYVYIECVLSYKLASSLRHRGWIEVNTEPPSFYLKITELKVWHSKE